MINIKKALKHYRDNGGELREQDIAKLVFPEKAPVRARTMFSQLKNGREVVNIQPDHVRNICQVLGVDANFLYNDSGK